MLFDIEKIFRIVFSLHIRRLLGVAVLISNLIGNIFTMMKVSHSGNLVLMGRKHVVLLCFTYFCASVFPPSIYSLFYKQFPRKAVSMKRRGFFLKFRHIYSKFLMALLSIILLKKILGYTTKCCTSKCSHFIFDYEEMSKLEHVFWDAGFFHVVVFRFALICMFFYPLQHVFSCTESFVSNFLA